MEQFKNFRQSYSDYNQVYNPATGTYFHTTGGGQVR